MRQVMRRVFLKKLLDYKAGLSLIAAGVLFLVSSYFAREYSWLGFIKAFSEAALIGGLADWFAVTAFFRHPLGLKLPHTAIISRNKDRIGERLGEYIVKEFLTPKIILKELKTIDIPKTIAERIIDNPNNLKKFIDEACFSLRELLIFISDEDVKRFASSNFFKGIRSYQFSPVLGKLLDGILSEQKHQAILDKGIILMEKFLDSYAQELSFWNIEKYINILPLKIVLKQIKENTNHKFRKIFEQELIKLSDKLQNSKEYVLSEEKIKFELLNNPAVKQGIEKICFDLKEHVLNDLDKKDSYLKSHAQEFLSYVVKELLFDPVIRKKLNRLLQGIVVHLAQNYRHVLGNFIALQVRSWNIEKFTSGLEQEIGGDLQYIRLNGTLVGGLIGVIIYGISILLK